MRITQYTTELEKNIPVLVKEKAFNYAEKKQLTTPQDIYDFMYSTYNLNKKAEEYSYLLAFNTKMKVVGIFQIGHGNTNSSICDPRDVFLKALLCGAVNIILVHNHPSGDCEPSDIDERTYIRVKAAGDLLGVRLIDNIIVGHSSYYSFIEHKIF